MNKLIRFSILIATLSCVCCSGNKVKPDNIKAKDLQANEIKAFCVDFNSAYGVFAEPGLWADASPEEFVKWHKDLGVNVIQTFCVSTNGYSWYHGDVVPEQPDLKTDFLREVVKLAHSEGMYVMGYFCIGANKRWAVENPDYSYGYPYKPHIPLTQKYLEYLELAVKEVVTETGIDGFMVDWLWQPDRRTTNGKWLKSEITLYEEIMNEKFPGEETLSEKKYEIYSRKALENCWDVIHRTVKSSNSDCVIWLSCNNTHHPHIVNSKILKEVDWLMNEAGDVGGVLSLKNMIGNHTKLLTCLTLWNKQDPAAIIPEAMKNNIGVYGYAKANPEKGELITPVQNLLGQPVNNLKGKDRIMGIMARYFNNQSLED